MYIAALQLVMGGVLCAAPVYENASAVCSNTDVRDLAVLGYEYLGYAYGNVALFDEYSRLSVTLQYHRENDSLHTNLTLQVMIAEKLLMDACEYYVESDLVMNSLLWESSGASH